MNHFKSIIENRYTTKVYDNSKKISDDKIEDLKEILRLSPSSVNSQPWKFIFVRDQNIKNKLSEVSLINTEKIKNCDTVVVFARPNNASVFENQLTHPISECYNKVLKPLGETYLIHWFEKQIYLSLGIFLSACASMDIDSTAMEGIDREKYNDILALKDFSTVLAVAIGYRDSEDFNQLHKKPKSRKQHEKVIVQL